MIRMVSMYHMGDQPTSFPEQFDLSEDSEEIEIEYFGRVLRVVGEEVQEERREFEEFWIGDEDDEVQECDGVSDNLETRNADISTNVPTVVIVHLGILTCRNASMVVIIPVDRNPASVEGTNFVRAARREGPREIEVVLDSGADISLAPMWMKKFGRKIPNSSRIILRDAQATRIRVSDPRVIEVNFEMFKET